MGGGAKSHALMKFFWATPDMVLAARASSAPLLLDATYNFTKSVLKLVVPCTVGPDNTTTVIGVAMIFQEDVQTWNWILAKLKQVCGFNGESPQTCPLTTIICDEDRAMGSAIDAHAKDYLGHFHRHICTYHLIIQHVQTAANQIFRGPGSSRERQKFMNTFWSIALDSDSRETSTFEREWDILMNLLPQDLGNTHMGFFNRVLLDRERWARRYTWARMVAGMSASSRVEGLHGAVKGAIPSGNKVQLCQVPVHIQAFVNKQEARGRQTEFNASQWSMSQQNAPQSVFLQVLNGVATPAAVKIVEKEWQKSMHYNITEVRHGSSSWPLAGAAPENFSTWKVIPVEGHAREETGEDRNDHFVQHDVLWE